MLNTPLLCALAATTLPAYSLPQFGLGPATASRVMAATGTAPTETLGTARSPASDRADADDVVQTRSMPWLLIVSGLGGEPFYSELFRRRAHNLIDIALDRLGYQADRVRYLAEPRPDAERETAAERAQGISTRAQVLQSIEALAQESGDEDRIVMVFIGHGTAQPGADGVARFNLPGPDLEPSDLGRALEAFGDKRVAVIVTSAASATFASALAAPNRVVITATASIAETESTRFADHFIKALAEDSTDLDKDGRVSLLEVYRQTDLGVASSYESDGRIRTEHAQLEDDGDGQARVGYVDDSTASTPQTGDGRLAARFHLDAQAAPSGALSAEQRRERLRLQLEARRLVDDIERLKRIRHTFSGDGYRARLQDLLVELALNRRTFKELEQP
ncbi:MAG: hypothetical protein KDK91_18880 [Gammaproteobacteria bacterium]|nr:hypothetical protein [Gammaproteobacteria bacterium]